MVHALSEAGVAKQGGVNKGDEIATIFGTNVQSMPYDQAIAVISSKPADADGGMTIELTLLAPGTAAEKNGGGGGRGDGDDGVAAMEFTISTAGAAAAFFPPPGEALVQLSVDGSTGTWQTFMHMPRPLMRCLALPARTRVVSRRRPATARSILC